MKVEQAKQIASNAIEQLRQAFDVGHSERLKEYLAAMARFRRYSSHNVMLIASQKPNATHGAGFHAWHELGRFVTKGEKGILTLAPIIRKKAENNGEGEPDESSTAVGFRAAYVALEASRSALVFLPLRLDAMLPCRHRNIVRIKAYTGVQTWEICVPAAFVRS